MRDRSFDLHAAGRLDRRRVLQLAGGTVGLNLSGLWQAQAGRSPSAMAAERTGTRSPIKSCIIVFYYGGPSHLDTYDLKPDAPADIRGEFQPIATNVSGIEICELLPRLAGCMDKLVPIRSVVGASGEHYSFQCLTGRLERPAPQGGWPEFGSCVTRLQGSTQVGQGPF